MSENLELNAPDVAVNTSNDGYINSGEQSLSNSESQPEVVEQDKPKEVTKTDDETKLPKGLERRLSKLTRQKYEQQSRIDELEKKLLEQTNRQPERARDEFSDDEWVEHVAHKKAQELFEKHQEKQQKEIERTQRAQHAANAWQSKIDSFKDEMPDFQQVVSGADIDLPVDVIQQIAESDIGPKIAYHLASNIDDAEKLLDMTERQRDRYLTRLEIKLEDTSFKKVEKSVPEVTKAAPTPKSRGATNVNVNENNMSIEDWMAARNKQVRGR